MRKDGRSPESIRPLKFTPHFLKNATGSCLIECGHTRVICAASLENSVPPFLKDSGKGWLTAEYSMLPQSTHSRTRRESTLGKQGGRTHEIQRLIGRALRGVCDLSRLGERTLHIDCDVLDADGGTRTASITGAYVAAQIAVRKILRDGKITANPFVDGLAAVSVGVVGGIPVVDLNYEEDMRAETDMNLVLTHTGKFIEVQGTAEHDPFDRKTLEQLLDLGTRAIEEIRRVQLETIEQALTK